MRRVARISNTSKSHRVEEMRHESDGGAAAPTVSSVPQIHREKYKGEVKGLSRSYANNCHRHHHCITGAADMIKYIIVAVIQCDIMTIIKQFVHQAVAFNYFFLHIFTTGTRFYPCLWDCTVYPFAEGLATRTFTLEMIACSEL